MVTAAGSVNKLSARVDITGGISSVFAFSMQRGIADINGLQNQLIQLENQIKHANVEYNRLFQGDSDAARGLEENKKQLLGLLSKRADAEREIAQRSQKLIADRMRQNYVQFGQRIPIDRQGLISQDKRIQELHASMRQLGQAIPIVEAAGNRWNNQYQSELRQSEAATARLNQELEETNRQIAEAGRRSENLQKMSQGFKMLGAGAAGFAAGFAGLSALGAQRTNQVQELAQSQLEAGIGSAQSIQRARRATSALGLDVWAGDEIIKEIGKEGKKKAAESTVDPGSEQAKRFRQFIPDRSPAELLEQANTDPEGYALYVLDTLQRVNIDQGPAQAGLLAEVLAGETGGDYAAGLINAGWFDAFVNTYKEATVLSDQQVDSTRRLAGAFGRLAFGVGLFLDAIGAGLEPILTPLLGWFASALEFIVDLMKENKTLATIIGVTVVTAFLAFSVAAGIVTFSLFQLWTSSLLATGGVASSGIAAAIASGGWWALAGAIWAAMLPFVVVLAIVAAVIAVVWFLQKRLGSVGEAFFQLKDFVVLALSPVLIWITLILRAVKELIDLLNHIPGVNIGTGAFDTARSSIDTFDAISRTQERFSQSPPAPSDSDSDDDRGPLGSLPTSIPGIGSIADELNQPASVGASAGAGISGFGAGSPAQNDYSQNDSNNYYEFNTENHFYGPDEEAGDKISSDIDEKLNTIPGRKFRS